MEMQFQKLVERITQFMENEARTETVVGQPFQLGEFSCIPVIRVGMGFGTGAAESDGPRKAGHGEGGGAGAGMGITPIGFLTSKGDQISFISTQQNTGLSKAFEQVPGLIEKFIETRATQTKVASN